MYDFLIVGAGLSGAVCADLLSKKGKKCLVIDRRDVIGGNCRCEETENIIVHKYGAHIFKTDNEEVWRYVNSFSEFNPFVNQVVADYNGELYSLPFNMNTFYQLWGCKTPEEAVECIERTRVRNDKPGNLKEHVLNVVGKDVYEKLIKGYTEKHWGKRCEDLPVDTMRRIPIRFTFDNNYYNSRHQGIPCNGYNEMIEKMLRGSEVRLGVDYIADKGLGRLAERIIYTGAIDELYGYALGRLEYRGLRFETEVLDVENYQGVAVMNFTSKDVPYTRRIEHKHFDRSRKSDKTVISREYPIGCGEKDEPIYPICDKRNMTIFDVYKKKAEQDGIILVGRLANYRYIDMSEAIENAMEVVRNI